MPKKRFSAEQIVTLLRQIGVLMAQGKPTSVACRDAGISLQLRDELLNGEIFYSLKEAQIVIEQWRGITTRSDRTPRSTIGRRRRSHSRPWLAI